MDLSLEGGVVVARVTTTAVPKVRYLDIESLEGGLRGRGRIVGKLRTLPKVRYRIC